MINQSAADRGQVRLLSYSIQGLGGHSGTLVFEVKSADYARGLGFDLELASDRKGLKEIRQAETGATEVAAALAVPAGAHRMALSDWNEALYPGQAALEAVSRKAAAQLQPTIANEVYGNANLSAETGYCGPPGGPSWPTFQSATILDHRVERGAGPHRDAADCWSQLQRLADGRRSGRPRGRQRERWQPPPGGL